MGVKLSLAALLISALVVSSATAQSFGVETPPHVSRNSTKVMLAATSYGVGGIGFHQLGRPGRTNILLGTGIFSATDFADRTIDGTVYTQRGVLLPLRFGIRNEIYRQQLSSLDWAFYWVSTVGPVLGFGY